MSVPHPNECAEGVTTSGSGKADASDDVGDGDNIRRFNKQEAAKYGIRSTSKNCIVNASSGCTVSSVSKLMFKACDHVYCSDCVYYYLNAAICTNGKTTMSCADTGCGASFDIDATFAAAALKQAEITTFEKQLNKNFLTVICPNGKCKAYLLMNGVGVNKVQCRKCHGPWFCKLCKRNWPANSGSNYTVCGNDDCGSAAGIFETLANCARHDHGIEKNVPDMRVCIKCHKFVTWTSGCKHATCSNKACNYKFCFVCLKPGKGCRLGTPCVVKEQTSINSA